jgi:hypothetical protein
MGANQALISPTVAAKIALGAFTSVHQNGLEDMGDSPTSNVVTANSALAIEVNHLWQGRYV